VPEIDPSDESHQGGMALLARGTKLFYLVAAFGLAAFSATLLGIAAYRLIVSFVRGSNILRQTLDCIGLVTIAIAVFEVGKFLVEEEVIRERQLRSVLEARRSLTKFLTIVIIVVSLEGLVLVFETKLDDVAELIYPTALLAVAAFVVIAMGLFDRLTSASVGNRIGPDEGQANAGSSV
jgi:uncharacterized paraquat-inducible protein A